MLPGFPIFKKKNWFLFLALFGLPILIVILMPSSKDKESKVMQQTRPVAKDNGK